MEDSTGRIVSKTLIKFALHFVLVHMMFPLSTRVIQYCSEEVDATVRVVTGGGQKENNLLQPFKVEFIAR